MLLIILVYDNILTAPKFISTQNEQRVCKNLVVPHDHADHICASVTKTFMGNIEFFFTISIMH